MSDSCRSFLPVKRATIKKSILLLRRLTEIQSPSYVQRESTLEVLQMIISTIIINNYFAVNALIS